MNFSRTYDLEASHQLTLGYSEDTKSYFSTLVTIEPEPQTVWAYKPPTQYLQNELQAQPLEVMLAFAEQAVRQETEGRTFVLPDSAYQQLQQAPNIVPVLASGSAAMDTDYVPGLEYQQPILGIEALGWNSDTSPVPQLSPEDQSAERADALGQLEYCVFELVRLRDIERGDLNDPHPEQSVEQRRNALLAGTAAGIASNVYAIASQLRPETFTAMANQERIEHWDIYTLLDERERRLINDYCESLCRSRLTDFPLAIQRGYNPTNGVPLDFHPHPETYDPATLFPSPQTETLYQEAGMTAEQAIECTRIQRLDIRDRTETDWNYLEQRGSEIVLSQIEQERA